MKTSIIKAVGGLLIVLFEIALFALSCPEIR